VQKLLSLFDYIHYRIYSFSKQKGDNAPETNGTIILTLLQCFTIIDLMVLVKILHDFTFPNKLAFVPLLTIMGMYNWYRYERNVESRAKETNWSDENARQRAIKGWLIGFYIIVVFLTPPIYGYLKVNLKVI
jgi:hypothetical protein